MISLSWPETSLAGLFSQGSTVSSLALLAIVGSFADLELLFSMAEYWIYYEQDLYYPFYQLSYLMH